MRKAPAIWSLILLALVAGGCKQIEITPDVHALEGSVREAYEALAKKDDFEASTMAAKDLKLQWSVFRVKYAHHGASAAEWAGDLTAVDELVKEVDRYTNSGHFSKARDAVLRTQALLYGLRQKHGIEYFPDMLASYRAVLDEVYARAMLEGPANTDFMVSRLGEARRRWVRIEGHEIRGEAYGLTPEGSGELKGLMVLEAAALKLAEQAAIEGDLDAMRDALRETIGQYDRILVIFTGQGK